MAFAGSPVAMPSVVITEIIFGLVRTGLREPRAHAHRDWLLDLINRAMVVLPLTAEAAEIAGELRAQQAIPPTGTRRRKGSRGEQHVAWIMDLFIAATVWAHGYDLVTRNVGDFERIAELLPAPDAESRLRVIHPE
jgi:predicted nucleic acid-binding protein